MSQLEERQKVYFPIDFDHAAVQNVPRLRTRNKGIIGYDGPLKRYQGSSAASAISKAMSTTPSKNATTKRMKTKTLNIHSRLFLLPLKISIHASLDDHLFAVLSCLPLLEKIYEYLLRVSSARAKKDGPNLWGPLREGKLKELAEFPHISPFAAALIAFPTLRCWCDAEEGPGYDPIRQQTLADALRVFDRQKVGRDKGLGKGSNEDGSRKGCGGGGVGSGGKGSEDTMQKFRFEELNFGNWSGNDGRGKGDERDEGGAESSYRGSGPTDAPKMPLEDTTLLLVPDESVGFIWSNDDTQDGTIIEKPSISDGPSPSQCIANDWRRRNPQSIILSRPLLTSAMSLAKTDLPSASVSSTTVCSSLPSPSPSLPSLHKCPPDAWHDKKNRSDGVFHTSTRS
ncbi:hypothetical protein J3R30DRAFT_3701252 [Lentinula aciculospora]|uniref:Uncharacterized protein n=1 Tax=Lentinula aciculospora TaxID=153920 RepID=A0A9W9AE36_9AGAR|nr:hypothetical protein J3R30DRAFT_3701252 [Lentinula aciculospora]